MCDRRNPAIRRIKPPGHPSGHISALPRCHTAQPGRVGPKVTSQATISHKSEPQHPANGADRFPGWGCLFGKAEGEGTQPSRTQSGKLAKRLRNSDGMRSKQASKHWEISLHAPTVAKQVCRQHNSDSIQSKQH